MDSRPFDDIHALIADLKPAPHRLRSAAPGGLGRLASVIDWIADWRGAAVVHRPIIALYAGAHRGDDVAALRDQMESIAAGAAPVSRAALHLGAGLDVFDLAIDRPVGDPAAGPTMSERECAATMAFGMEALAKQPDLLVLGALGEGANRAAAALDAALSRTAAGDDPLQALRQVGGRETAALCGAIVAAGSQRVPVLLEGYSAAAAAATLHAVSPAAVAHCRVGQIGAEPGHSALVQRLDLTLLFEFGVTIGDGTGSTAVLSLIKLACALPLETTS